MDPLSVEDLGKEQQGVLQKGLGTQGATTSVPGCPPKSPWWLGLPPSSVCAQLTAGAGE